MKKLIYTLLITFISVSAYSQSEAIYTFNLFNQLNFNPAYAGSKEVLDVGLIYRNQWWSGIDGAPKNLNLYGHMPFCQAYQRHRPQYFERQNRLGQSLVRGSGLCLPHSLQ